jgi:hypothetical protein
MMPDWQLVLSLLGLVPIAFLFGFAGCTGQDPIPPPDSLLKLTLDLDLQKTPTSDTRQVRAITVSWTLWSIGAPIKTVPAPPAQVVPTGVREFLDPFRDPTAEYTVKAATSPPVDHVSCTCEVSIGLAGDHSQDETKKVESNVVPFSFGTTYVFELTPKPPASPSSKRDFVLVEFTPDT